MILTGTIVNAAGIFCGGALGLFIHKFMQRGIPERYSDLVMKGIGFCTVYIAFGGILSGDNSLVTILSMVIGAVIGEWLDLDGRLSRLSATLESRFFKGSTSSFAQGFMSSTLLFCVGTMSILGALRSGLQGDHSILFSKSVMDTISSVIFASSLGLGVLFSSVSVLLYQGIITLLASVAQPFLTDAVIAEMDTVGSLLLFGLSLDLLGVKHFKLMNLVPAIFLPILLCAFL